jgi:hypothetical protein
MVLPWPWRPLRFLFAAGAGDDLAYFLDVLADAGDGIAACQGKGDEGESEYFFHLNPLFTF